MKKVITIIALFICSFSFAQNAKIDSKGNFTAITATSKSKDSTATGKTYTDTKGKVYPVFTTRRGKFFVPKISKTGNYYRMYLTIKK